MIVRGPRSERDFTILANAVLRDDRLSFKARGLLGHILSLKPGAKITSEALASAGREGRSAVRSGLTELETVGYLKRSKRQDERGRWITSITVYEDPEQAPDETKKADYPKTENRSSAPPATLRETAGQTEDRKPDVGEPVPKREVPTREVPTTEELTPPATPRPKSKFAAQAQAIAKDVHDERRARGEPGLANWIAAVKVIEKMLAAGWGDGQVAEACRAAPTISVGALEFHLRGKTTRRPGNVTTNAEIDWEAEVRRSEEHNRRRDERRAAQAGER